MTGLDAAAGWLALGYCLMWRSDDADTKVEKWFLIFGALSAGAAGLFSFVQWVVS